VVLTLDVVSSNPQLNSHSLGKVFSFASGQTAKVILRLWQADKKIRYIPDPAAVITVDLKRSDNTILTKTCAFTFADDRSIVEFELSELETAQVIGQNLVVKIVEGLDTKFAVLQFGLQKVILDGSC
jgi:hypothetical protein